MGRISATNEDIFKFTEIVRKVNFFSQMTVGQLEKIYSFVMLFEYKKGETIFKQGASGDAFYVLYTGGLGVQVKKGFFSSPVRVAGLKPGEVFGEMALLDRSPRTATIVAEEDSKVFVLLAEHFNEVAKTSPEFMAYMKSMVAARKFEQQQGK